MKNHPVLFAISALMFVTLAITVGLAAGHMLLDAAKTASMPVEVEASVP
jgi:hypothetical protein